MAERFVKFYRLFEFLVSPKVFSFIPLLLYSLNKHEESILFAKCHIFYIFFTHQIKRLLYRKRPYSYLNIFNHDNVKSSSFPSNHTAGSVILSSFFPKNFTLMKIIFVLLMQLNRIILGCHFPSDTIIGALIGFFILFVSSLIENRIILILILFLIFLNDPYFSWIFGSSLSFFVYNSKSNVKLNPLLSPICFLIFPFVNLVKKIFQKQVECCKSVSLFVIYFSCYCSTIWILFFISCIF